MTVKDFDSDKLDEYAARAKETWGNTDAYKEFEEKEKCRTADDHKEITAQMMDIFAEFGSIKNQSPDSDEAKSLAGKLQDFITEHYYHCTDEIFEGLGKAYGAGGEFTKNINEAVGEGVAEFASEVIVQYCKK